jgi:UPF0716 family protein affecting phage T7 exclusion
MNIARRIAMALVWLPIAEIVVFILVAMALGFWAAALLMVLTSVLGAILLRLAGRTHLRHFRNSPGITLTADATGRGLTMVLAGILLLLPGFITDVVGLLILLPATRRRIGLFVNGLIARAGGGDMNAPPVVDLEPDEWQRHSTRQPQPGDTDGKPRPIGHSRPD